MKSFAKVIALAFYGSVISGNASILNSNPGVAIALLMFSSFIVVSVFKQKE